jgi:hypothetical protein
MKSYLKVLPVAILFALYSYFHDRNSYNQHSNSIQVSNSPSNKNVHPTKSSNNNYSPPQQQIEPAPVTEKPEDLELNRLKEWGATLDHMSRCEKYASAERYCAPAGNGFDACMLHTIGSNFKKIQAECH